MAITAQAVAALREKTGAGMMECKKALTETDGDVEGAIKLLRERGKASMEKKAGRAANEGVVGSYVHLGGKIGVLVELNCETDFVARNEDFQALARELAMQIAFSNPSYLRPEDIPEDVLARERDIAANLARNEGRPEAALPKIVEGRVKKFADESSLLTQTYMRDNKRKVGDLVEDVRAKIRENIGVRRFVRFQVGEEI
ncbi:MAG: translation elongation factor Ts [Armatimonadetes bacterium]|nr:translation elongation factor Ts [Armatimonadota bacterium]